jgi:hypothetical protein
MSDLADRAQAEQERLVALREKYGFEIDKKPAPQATGFCLNCGVPVEKGRRWCGAECRDDWEWFDAHCK